MKIEIPDWAQDGYLSVTLNHMELVAYKQPGKDSPIIIKVDRCNHCLECCLSVGPEFDYYDESIEKCKFLTDQGLCNAGPMRPVKCTDDPPKGKYRGCSLTYRNQDV